MNSKISAAAEELSFATITAAADRLAGRVHRTPVMTSATLDARSGARLFFKCEMLQKVGAFKARGALNTLLQLTPAELRAGVVTHSSGNHGQAVAWAARSLGCRATVVMPDDSNRTKVAAVRGYGAEVVLCPPGTEAREAAVAAIRARSGATLVHPYDDARVVAGQGTAALELLQELDARGEALDIVVTPVGGGGLLSGTALAASGFAGVRVYGAEPEAVDDAARSFAAGTLQSVRAGTATQADGLRSSSLGDIPFAVIKARVTGIWTVSEAEISAAVRLVTERMKLVIEPSSAVAVAAVLKQAETVRGRRVGIVLTGGNVDFGG